MKILHIIPAYFPTTHYAGPIGVAHSLNKSLVENNHRVVVFTTNMDGDKCLSVPIGIPQFLDGVEVWYFPVNIRFWFYSYKMHLAIRSKLKDFDLIHITSVFLAISTLGSFYARKFLKPYIISPHGSLMIEPLKKFKLKKFLYLSFIENKNLLGAAKIHFTANIEKKEYELSELPIKDSFIIPNFLATIKNFPTIGSFRKKFGFKLDDKLVLSLSRLNWKKGFDTLIPAFKEVIKKNPKAKLIIAGEDEGGYRDKIEKSVIENNLQEVVFFVGELDGDNKISAYLDSDVFVLPSYAENFAMTVLEAAQCSLPSVVTPMVGLAEDIKKNKAGLVVEKKADLFAEAILDLISDNNKRLEMGKNSKLMSENFTPEKLAPLWDREYYSIINYG
jgi:glycosyltransferase involved in cell wall biosynthesis